MPVPGIVDATRSFEKWLAQRTKLVRADMDYKHQQMAADTFSFMRATYYRWAQLWPEVCPDLAVAPALLGVGDLHVENFGTWRDIEGRLVWGVNDFDEVHLVAYTNDLVRLAVSARLAARAGQLQITLREGVRAILTGYGKEIRGQGRPVVLAESDHWLRVQALGDLRDPVTFWAHMERLPAARGVPVDATQALLSMMPKGVSVPQVRRRRAGLGSLGHQRYVALADWFGGRVAREAKAMVPPAAEWVHPTKTAGRIHYQTILARAVRCPDHTVSLRRDWLVRRLGPDCSRIELTSLPVERDEARLLRVMGRETANIHHGTPGAIAAVRRDLDSRPSGWLRKATRRMERALLADWQDWRASRQTA